DGRSHFDGLRLRHGVLAWGKRQFQGGKCRIVGAADDDGSEAEQADADRRSGEQPKPHPPSSRRIEKDGDSSRLSMPDFSNVDHTPAPQWPRLEATVQPTQLG